MRRLVLGCLFMLGALMVGCGSDPGSIAVSWSVGLSDDCEGGGISTVRITLTEEGGTVLGPFDASCPAGENGSTFKIADVDEGSYNIDLQGLDGDGVVIYTGHADGRTNVTEGSTATPEEIILTPAPAQLTIQWRFADGLGCPTQTGAPDEVVVTLFKSNALETSESADCVLQQLIIGELEADDDYDVRVVAQNGDDELFFFEELDIALSDGEQRTVTGDLVACPAAGCD